LDSCNSVHELASILFSVDVDQLSFPNERDAATLFSKIFSGYSHFSASQKDTLDKLLFDDLLTSFGIRDQAHLTALSHSSGTSSGWFDVP